MRIETAGEEIRITLSQGEGKLLRRALERASFIDTPVSEQAGIQEFCARVLDALGAA